MMRGMIIFGYRFQPGWLMTLIAMIAVTTFVCLGQWQLDRADLKKGIKSTYENRLKDNYQTLDFNREYEALKFRKLNLYGVYDSSRNLLLDNRVYNGQVGYQILTPFILNEGNKIVLVNRGWVAMGLSREDLPNILPPVTSEAVSGIVNIPESSGFRMGDISFDGRWPQVIPFIDLALLNDGYELEVLPFILWLGDDQAGHYKRDWNPVWADPEKSKAYALQWFAFAFIALLLFFVLNFRKLK